MPDWRHRNPGSLSQFATGLFVTKNFHHLSTGANEGDFAILAYISEVRVFRKEPVAGMNGINVAYFRRTHDTVNAQIAVGTGAFPDAHCLIGHLHVHGVGVGLRINGDGANVQFAAGANDAHGDFTAVGNEDFLEHLRVASSVRLNAEKSLAVFNRLGILDEDLGDDTAGFGLDFIHHFHGLDNAKRLTFLHRIACRNKRRIIR